MSRHLRGWLPCSAVSKFALGNLMGVVLEAIFPGKSPLTVGILLFAVSSWAISDNNIKKLEYLLFGIFFFSIIIFLNPKRFQIEESKRKIRTETVVFGETERDFQKSFREKIGSDLENAELDSESRGIALGLVFGESKRLSKDFKEKAKQGGILHLFAASGLHLGIWMGVQFQILKRIPGLPFVIARIVPLLTGFLYLSALGYPVSLARAWVFAGLILLQGVFLRKLRPADLLLNTAWILWIWDPLRFHSVSFCLSFGAVAGIFLFSNPTKLVLNFMNEENRFISILKENLSVSFSAGLGTMPVLLYSFGSFSFGSVLLNLMVVPLAGIVLPSIYISLLLQQTGIDWIVRPCWNVSEFMIEILFRISDTLAEPLGFYKEMGNTIWIGMIGWIFLCFWTFAAAYVSERCVSRKKRNRLSDIRIDLWKPPEQPGFFRKKNAFIVGAFSVLCMIFVHAVLYRTADYFPETNRIVNNGYFFLLRNRNSLYFSGKCKYGYKKLSEAFYRSRGLFCDRRNGIDVSGIFVDDRSCLEWAMRCIRSDSKIPISYSGKDAERVQAEDPKHIRKSERFRDIQLPGNSRILLFHTKHDSLTELVRKTAKGRGWIVLETPFGSKDNSRIWNRNRKLLGLGEGWVFLEKHELQRIPVSESF
ncbi:ComEC/Rec2 family competence protein [Leptospira gomenensis]|uniref:ComEC/Rec2 family competence protein n=1 Tax=Leptospira gomenensis TaxID=2484974 RepID=A0A5F1YY82_9LEPT|nr:ComEC/Rec2 family competence protein [Leptospira gomenensis]TGK34966.1 ComEC/Rec2 family competence protein [Leptospira gomenensis]TGK36762.1 ComEC/Rec2 family competence protein [Leptospira gomenensis]TGK48833.1 ComEC/Rec2 family competence protein [Leptospira gomenensis]TGK64599.1 ComEC/Rec2 family competence protein [Leptospira gomenensis]